MNVKIDKQSGETKITLEAFELQEIMKCLEALPNLKDPNDAFYLFYREICNEAYKP